MKTFNDRTHGFNTVSNELENAFLVYFDNSNNNANLKELEDLAKSSFLNIVGSSCVNLREINPASYIGVGKVEEFKALVEEKSVDVIIFDVMLTGSQIRNLQDGTGAKVIDRNMLILDIFASRAKTAEGKLQVELAQLKYTLPRLAGISGSQGRFGSGGVGMRGPGETKLELDKRKVQENITKLERELKDVEKKRGLTRSKRVSNANLVCLVGYTNAGKSSLMNVLSKANAYADDRLFATLDVLTKRVWDDGVEYTLTDTVGFVSNLPHTLVNAFSATLEECRDADCLLLVVDSADPNALSKYQVVLGELENLNVDKNKMIVVFNKMDKVENTPFDVKYKNVKISAKKNMGILDLKKMIRDMLV